MGQGRGEEGAIEGARSEVGRVWQVQGLPGVQREVSGAELGAGGAHRRSAVSTRCQADIWTSPRRESRSKAPPWRAEEFLTPAAGSPGRNAGHQSSGSQQHGQPSAQQLLRCHLGQWPSPQSRGIGSGLQVTVLLCQSIINHRFSECAYDCVSDPFPDSAQPSACWIPRHPAKRSSPMTPRQALPALTPGSQPRPPGDLPPTLQAPPGWPFAE